MVHRLLALTCALAASLAWAPAAIAQPEDDERPRVTALRYALSDGGVRMILDVDPVPAFTVFTVNGPDRLILDFPVVDWRLHPEAVQTVSHISGVRQGLFRHNRSRMVLDLAQPMKVESAFTTPPSGTEPGRLIVDLALTTRAAFDAAAGVPESARWQGRAATPPAPLSNDLIVAIDPGHGGIDPGATGGTLVEKDVVLGFAQRLAAEIDRHDGVSAYLIRQEDEFVPLAERVARAHAARANLLLSVHADSVKSGTANGMSVYTLSEKGTDEAAEAFAARENRADVLGGADLFGESDAMTRLLVELAQRGTRDESQKLAGALIRSLEERVTLLQSKPLRRGNFRVLKAPDMPSVLIELGFLDSAEDRKRLADPDWQTRAAQSVVEGILDWRKKASPGFVAPR